VCWGGGGEGGERESRRKGVASVREAGKERAEKGIPKVAESKGKRKNCTTLNDILQIRKKQRGESQQQCGRIRD